VLFSEGIGAAESGRTVADGREVLDRELGAAGLFARVIAENLSLTQLRRNALGLNWTRRESGRQKHLVFKQSD
jgi:hypothetical protein